MAIARVRRKERQSQESKEEGLVSVARPQHGAKALQSFPSGWL